MAIGVLHKFDRETHDEINPIILLENIEPFKDTCIFSIAFSCECQNFMSEIAVQNTLTDIWLNGMKRDDSHLICRSGKVINI